MNEPEVRYSRQGRGLRKTRLPPKSGSNRSVGSFIQPMKLSKPARRLEPILVSETLLGREGLQRRRLAVVL
jgi:hypothetical protein